MVRPKPELPTPFPMVDADWLSTTEEAVLEPDLPIIDPHHHLWDFPEHRYLLPDFLTDISGDHNIIGTVFIECHVFYRAEGPVELRPVGETQVINGAAAMAASGIYGDTKVAAGIIGHADLSMGAAVEGVLQAHIAAGGGRFRGIRHAAALDPSPEIPNSRGNPPPHLYRDHAGFKDGFRKLGALGLVFDAWVFHTQLRDVIALARAFPNQPIVMDHVGGPLGIGIHAGKRAEIFPGWQADMREMAKCDNVSVKLGGIGKRLCGFGFEHGDGPPSSERMAEAYRPYFEVCIEAFGPSRCMFESNFPVDKVSGSYTLVWNSYKRIAAGASEDEKRLMFHDVARDFYRLAC